MLKRTLLAGLALTLSSSFAFAAGTMYIGGSVGEATNTSETQNVNYRGLPLTLNAGYGALLSQNFYLAGEAFGVLGSASLNDNGLKSTYGYGLSLLPGIMLGDHTMTYVRMGFVRSRFTPNISNNRNVNGGQLGLGLQLGLTQNLDLRGEYIFTAYQSFSGVASPKQDAFNIGVIYKFD